MVPAALKRTLVSILVLIGSGLWVAALLIMAQTVQQSAHFSDLHPFIVGVNVAGLLVLLMLIGGRLVQLIRDWRKRVVGSRLEARMVWMSATLAMVPLLLVFYFSVMFLNRGIDSWFHVEIRQGLEDALTLSRAALDLRMREYMQRTRTIAGDLAAHGDPVAVLDERAAAQTKQSSSRCSARTAAFSAPAPSASARSCRSVRTKKWSCSRGTNT